MNTAVLALSTIAVVQYLQLRPNLHGPLEWSLYSFALCIPLAAIQVLLVSSALDVDEETGLLDEDDIDTRMLDRLSVLTYISFYVGAIYMFGYLSLEACLIFMAGSIVGSAIWSGWMVPEDEKKGVYLKTGAGALVLSFFGSLGVTFPVLVDLL